MTTPLRHFIETFADLEVFELTPWQKSFLDRLDKRPPGKQMIMMSNQRDKSWTDAMWHRLKPKTRKCVRWLCAGCDRWFLRPYDPYVFYTKCAGCSTESRIGWDNYGLHIGLDMASKPDLMSAAIYSEDVLKNWREMTEKELN